MEQKAATERKTKAGGMGMNVTIRIRHLTTDALRFWRQHKSALLTLAQRGNAPAAIAKAEGGAA